MDNPSDILADLIGQFNDLSIQSVNSLQLDLQAAGTATVTLPDGGIAGNTYTSSIPHNLKFAPMFLAYFKGTGINQYFPLPNIPALDGMGASIGAVRYAYADGTNLNICINFYSPTGGPIYSPNTTFDFAYFIFRNPIYTN